MKLSDLSKVSLAFHPYNRDILDLSRKCLKRKEKILPFFSHILLDLVKKNTLVSKTAQNRFSVLLIINTAFFLPMITECPILISVKIILI